jgi:hypothetical protein
VPADEPPDVVVLELDRQDRRDAGRDVDTFDRLVDGVGDQPLVGLLEEVVDTQAGGRQACLVVVDVDRLDVLRKGCRPVCEQPGVDVTRFGVVDQQVARGPYPNAAVRFRVPWRGV